MEIPRSVAERKLREHRGNVVEALVALTNWTVFLIQQSVKPSYSIVISLKKNTTVTP